MVRTGLMVSVNRHTGVGRDKAVRPVVVDLAQLDQAEFHQLWNDLVAKNDEREQARIALAMKHALMQGTDVLPKIAQIPDDQFVQMWSGSSPEERWKVVGGMKRKMTGKMSMPGSSFDDISDILA